MEIVKRYYQYICKNILGEIAVSLYFFVDTYFISVAEGTNGITALNLVLPIYGLIYAIGAMIGRGSAIQFTLHQGKKEEQPLYFFHAIAFCILFGLIFSFLGFFTPELVLGLMGGDAEIIAVGTTYTRIFMTFSPFFMLNLVFNAFIRNDGSPTLAMVAVLASSLLNIIGDYLLMFPLGMGMAGAALATSLAPIVGIFICSLHFLKKCNTISIQGHRLSLSRLYASCKLGFSSFVAQLASGITTFVFNLLLLHLSGNDAVAAYGVIANIALMASAIFTGMATGGQPLISEYAVKHDKKSVVRLVILGNLSCLILAVLTYAIVFFNRTTIIMMFNSENNLMVESYAELGLIIYFLGFFFSGINIVGTEFFSAIGYAKPSIIASSMRGFLLIIISAITMSYFFGIIGIWLSYPLTELIVLFYVTASEIKYAMES